MKIALIHHFWVNSRGGEKVLSCLSEIFPQADIFFLLGNKELMKTFKGKTVNTSWVQYLPYSVTKFRNYFFLYPFAIKSFNLSKYDLCISSSAGFSHGIEKSPNSLHVSYCHTPSRYVWHWRDDFLKTQHFGQKQIVNYLLDFLKYWEFKVSQKVDFFVANSSITKERIAKYYKRDSQIIYPPVKICDINLSDYLSREKYFLFVSSLVSYKGADIAIKAFNNLKMPLKIVGEGPLKQKLKSISNSNIEFLDFVDRKKLVNLYRSCRALIYPAEEDFGIVPVEAQAAGCPVIAFGKGGILDTVVENTTGDFFYEQSPESIIEKVLKFKAHMYDSKIIRVNALKFSEEKFKIQFQQYIYDKIGNNQMSKK